MDTLQNVPSWHQLLGSNNWEGLLEPLNLKLRHLILRCGDFCEATYDAFNNDQTSNYCGSSRFGKSSFFQKVMLPSLSDYQVHTFLYATAKISVRKAFLLHSLSRDSWDRESNWIGYIAITTDEASKVLGRREIYVAFRGTSRSYEWINVLGARPESAEELLRPKPLHNNENVNDNVPKVMKGWLNIYTSNDPRSLFTKLSTRTQLLTKINELRDLYKDEELSIIFTGHSLGATLSILAAFDLVENGITDIPVSAIVFGSPQVGNKAFNERVKELPNLKILHIKNKIDLIPQYPSRLLGYVKSGIKLNINTRKSPYLKDSKNPRDWHNLQALLHVVDGWNGSKCEFELKVNRSLWLINKRCSYLKEDHLVPSAWWIEKNKGMMYHENDDSPKEEDLPTPESFAPEAQLNLLRLQ